MIAEIDNRAIQNTSRVGDVQADPAIAEEKTQAEFPLMRSFAFFAEARNGVFPHELRNIRRRNIQHLSDERGIDREGIVRIFNLRDGVRLRRGGGWLA